MKFLMNKSELREEIFKVIYSLEVQKNNSDEQLELYFEGSDISEKDINKIKESATQILEQSAKIEEEIAKNLKSEWKIDRVSKINMSILKIAIYEILYKKLPYKISINEAVELAKKYGEETSASFINGILASVVKDNNLISEEKVSSEIEDNASEDEINSEIKDDASEN